MLDARQYAAIVKGSALYDLLVTLPFATPWTFALLGWGLSLVDASLGLPGTLEAPHGLSMLMGNLMGSVVIVWSVARLRLDLPILGRYDAAARFLFAAWQLHALAEGISWIIVPFLVIEIGFGIAQSLPVRGMTMATS